MAKTTNINLNLTEDENTSFVDWRKSIDGNNDSENKSNMQIIDEEIGNHETRITTLESADGGGKVYKHDVTIFNMDGVTAVFYFTLYSSKESLFPSISSFNTYLQNKHSSVDKACICSGAVFVSSKWYPLVSFYNGNARYITSDNTISVAWPITAVSKISVNVTEM